MKIGDKILGVHEYEARPEDSKYFVFCKHCDVWVMGHTHDRFLG